MRTVQLSLDTQHAALILSTMADEYVKFNRMADTFDRHGSPGVVEHVGATFREHAEICRQIGQQVELLVPEIEPENWRWPQ